MDTKYFNIRHTCLLFFVFFITACNEKNDIVVEKKYYDNGALKEEIPRTKKGLIHGKMIGYYENGDTMSYSTWNEGKREGVEKAFYPNGKLEGLIYLKNGKPDGKMISFYESGNIDRKGTYRDSLLNGELVAYFDSKGYKVSSINNYINFQGVQKPMGWIVYNEDGFIKSEESRIKILSEKDTVILGDSISIDILITVPRYDSTYFFIGNYDEKFFLKEPMNRDTILAKNNSRITYKLKSSKKGINYIRGGAKNYQVLPPKKMKRRVIVRPELYFEYSYYVK